MKIVYPNFDFEHELADSCFGGPSPGMRVLHTVRAAALASLVAADDVVWLPCAAEWSNDSYSLPNSPRWLQPNERVSNSDVIAWGWSAHARRWCDLNDCSFTAPPLTSVVHVNDRLFAAELEQRLQPRQCQSHIVRSMADARDAVAHACAASGGWIAKARFGMAGREQRRSKQPVLAAADAHWLEKRLSRDQALILEPWLMPVLEAGLQFEISPGGGIEFQGMALQQIDARGQYVGSRILAETPLEWMGISKLVAAGLTAVEAAGYFGPVGVDVMQYRTPEGELRWRIWQDINARWTFGRVAVECHRRFSNIGRTTLRFAAGCEPPEELRRLNRDESTIWRLSPTIVQGQPARSSVWLVHETA